jgi:bifunctional DNA-binding transcriptional regulator/antitoxin component of YhaV-PrlF toxin-antitoxin module
VTIPKAFRRSLGIGPGTKIVFEMRRGELLARKISAEDPLDALVGLAGRGRTDDFLVQARGRKYDRRLDGPRR